MASSVLENIRRTTQATLDGYNKWEIEAIMAPRADDCLYRMLPESLGVPVRNNHDYREYYTTQVLPVFQDFKATIGTTVYDAEARKSVLHGFSDATSPVGPYHVELCLILTFNDAGDKVVKMEEMFDSAYFVEFLGKLQQHMAAQGTESA